MTVIARRTMQAAGWALVLAALARATPAGAQGTVAAQTAAMQAADLVKEGAAAAAKGDHEACARAYAAALALAPEHAAAGELGLCEEALGRHVAAHDHLLYALEGEVPGAPPPAPATWQRFKEAYRRVSRRVVRVFLLTDRNQAEVFVDGRSVGAYVSGRYFTVTPGAHTWTAKHGAHTVTVPQTGRGGDLPDVGLWFARDHLPPWSSAWGMPPRPAPAPELPFEEACAAADGVLMSREMCALFEGIFKKMDPTLLLIGGGLLSIGLTADVGPGFFVGGSAVWRRQEDVGFHLGFEVQALMPTKGVTRADGKPLDFSFVTLGIVPCIRYKWVLGCAAADGGVAVAGGPSPLSFPDGPPILPVLRLGPRLALDIPFAERVGARVFADVRLSPIPPSDLGFDGPGGRRWEHPTVSGLAGVGVFFQ